VTSTANARGERFRLDIQGLRAVAVGAVVLSHAGIPFLAGGYVGVDVFFVISGFLITSHLLGGLDRDGRVRFSEFYARRARRILPASFLVLALTVLTALVWLPPLLLRDVWRDAVATALYVPNIVFAIDGTDYLAGSTPSLFQHYWSLGVEEQFYLIWPVLLAVGGHALRSRRSLAIAMAVLTAASFSACVYLTAASQPLAFFLLPTRAWELGFGGLAAMLLSRRPTPLGERSAAVAGWLGFVGILLAVVLFDDATVFPGAWAALPVVATALVIVGGATPNRLGPGRMLSLRGMVFVGAISYSLYLVHWPALMVPQLAAAPGDSLPLWVSIGIVALCIPAAWLLFRYVENPVREAAVLTSARPRRTLVAAAAGSVITIAVASGAYGYSMTVPLSGQVPGAVPRDLTPSLLDAHDDLPELYVDGCHRGFSSTDSTGCLFGDPDRPRIALFGDSHAAQWFPALTAYAQQAGYAVETFTKSACPVASADVLRDDGTAYVECTTWRDGVIARLNEEAPVLVVVASSGSARQLDEAGDHAAAREAAMGQTFDRLTPPTVMIADTPRMDETPSICLSAHLDDIAACARPRDAALASPSRSADAAAAATHDVPLIDLTDHICGPSVCSPVIGDILVFRDEHHLTATFSAMLAGPLGEALASNLN
jgi:peptidoglycan/LPS O-acetylase OafA/YrhL